MKLFDPLSWILVAPLMPLFIALEESEGFPTPKANLILGIYGYLVVTGAVFNAALLLTFLMDICD